MSLIDRLKDQLINSGNTYKNLDDLNRYSTFILIDSDVIIQYYNDNKMRIMFTYVYIDIEFKCIDNINIDNQLL